MRTRTYAKAVCAFFSRWELSQMATLASIRMTRDGHILVAEVTGKRCVISYGASSEGEIGDIAKALSKCGFKGEARIAPEANGRCCYRIGWENEPTLKFLLEALMKLHPRARDRWIVVDLEFRRNGRSTELRNYFEGGSFGDWFARDPHPPTTVETLNGHGGCVNAYNQKAGALQMVYFKPTPGMDLVLRLAQLSELIV